MTDDQTGMSGGAGSGDAQEPVAATPPEAPKESLADQASEMFSSSEGMVAFGGAVVAAGWLLFDVILNDFYTDWLILLFAVLALLLPRANRAFVEKFAPLPALMKAVGYLLALTAAFSLVENIRYASGNLDDFVEILGALVLYAGAGITLMGARSIDA